VNLHAILKNDTGNNESNYRNNNRKNMAF
jgi:hypothetical protein